MIKAMRNDYVQHCRQKNRIKKYFTEHRIILERVLNRPILSYESTHHINGIKFDNRLENLMLFKTEKAHQDFERKGIEVENLIIFDGRKYREMLACRDSYIK